MPPGTPLPQVTELFAGGTTGASSAANDGKAANAAHRESWRKDDRIRLILPRRPLLADYLLVPGTFGNPNRQTAC